MDHDEPELASEAGTASAPASVEGSDAQKSAPTEGVLSGVGPNTDAVLQVAREKGWTDRVPYEYAELTNNKDHRDWAGIAVRYEWKDDYGDVGPAVPELEQQLFHSDLISRAGDKLDE